MACPEPLASSFFGCFVRLLRMTGRIVIPLLVSPAIFGQRFPSTRHFGSGPVVPAVIPIRRVDIRYLRGRTAEANRASLADRKLYASM